MKIYYAHAMCIYGTEDEKKELLYVKKNFPDHKIVDPGSYANNPEKRNGTMDYCKKLVSDCDALVFTRLLDEITAGVGVEINHALEEDKSVYELKDGKINQIKKPVKFISRLDTISLYAKYRMKKLQLRLN